MECDSTIIGLSRMEGEDAELLSPAALQQGSPPIPPPGSPSPPTPALQHSRLQQSTICSHYVGLFPAAVMDSAQLLSITAKDGCATETVAIGHSHYHTFSPLFFCRKGETTVLPNVPDLTADMSCLQDQMRIFFVVVETKRLVAADVRLRKFIMS